MPIANRCVEPVCVSQVKVPKTVENDFEYIFNATLSNFIKQIACLTIKAKDIFDELTGLLVNFVDRGLALENKIDQINFQLKSNENLVIKPLVSEQIQVYKAFITRDDELLVHTEMPDCIRELFEKADPPPELDKFDQFRKDETESLRFYTDPEFFLREWLKNVRVEKKKKREKKKRKSTSVKSNLPLPPPPAIVNFAVQETYPEDITVNYNFGDVAIYEEPMKYKISEENNINSKSKSRKQSRNSSELPSPPPPPLAPPLAPTLAPPVAPPIAPPPAPVFINTDSALPPPAPKVDSIQSLLRDIQKGATLKPVAAQEVDKRKTRDFRAMIAELRPAWDNNSDSEETDED